MKSNFPRALFTFALLAACGSPPAAAEPVAQSTDRESDLVPDRTPPSTPIEERPSIALEPPDDVHAPPADAEVTESGLASRVLFVGDGTTHPAPYDQVTVHYTGWKTSGERFDSSVERGRAASFQVDRLIAGWTEGLQLMVVGERRRMWIPEALAYQGRPNRPSGMLVFDVELLSIEAGTPPPSAPDDVAAPPAHAERTASGLASVVLRAGTGTAHPTETSSVTVHYSGWRAETGELFDSSVSRGRPATFPLNRVIAGWTEGVQLMVVGEQRRLWIPAALAYASRPSAPQGMLVFDIELLAIE